MQFDSLNFFILLSSEGYSLDLKKLNREKLKSSAKLQEFILPQSWAYVHDHSKAKAKLSLAIRFPSVIPKNSQGVIVKPLKNNNNNNSDVCCRVKNS